MAKQARPPLSPLEHAVMEVVWARRRATADDVRAALEASHGLKDSTVRTVLRRLEEKGYAEHAVEGRTYVYAPKVAPTNVAAQQVRGIIDRFCRGSVENLLVGMADDRLVTPDLLRRLAERIDAAESGRVSEKSQEPKRPRK